MKTTLSNSITGFVLAISIPTMVVHANITDKKQEAKPIYKEHSDTNSVIPHVFNPQINSKANNDYASQNSFEYMYSILMNKLDLYSLLENGWDGYSGLPPKQEVINTSKSILKYLLNASIVAPQIMLSGQGEIGFYWGNKTHSYIEVCCKEDAKYSYLLFKDKSIFCKASLSLDQLLPFKEIISVVKENNNKPISLG